MAGDKVIKGFRLQSDWSELQADVLDQLLDQLVGAQVSIRVGTYTGNGVPHTITVREMAGPPVVMFIETTSTGTVTTITSPRSTGPITAWDQQGFTLAWGSSLNTVGAGYRFVVIGSS